MDAGLWDLATYTLELRPGGLLEPLQCGAGLANRKIVCTSPFAGTESMCVPRAFCTFYLLPRGSVFYVIVAGHVLGHDGDGQVLVPGQHEGSREADDSGAGVVVVSAY